jgi:hypothetical protein
MTIYQPAVPYPVLPVSDVEKQAIDELMPKLDTTGCEDKAAQIRAKARARLTFETTDPTVVPDFLARKNSEEQAQLEAQIAAMRERSEPS